MRKTMKGKMSKKDLNEMIQEADNCTKGFIDYRGIEELFQILIMIMILEFSSYLCGISNKVFNKNEKECSKENNGSYKVESEGLELGKTLNKG